MKKNEELNSLLTKFVYYDSVNPNNLSFKGLGRCLNVLEDVEKKLYYALGDLDKEEKEDDLELLTQKYIYRKTQLSVTMVMYDIINSVSNEDASNENVSYIKSASNGLSQEVENIIMKLKEIIDKIDKFRKLKAFKSMDLHPGNNQIH